MSSLEAGIGALRVHFVRETTPGTTPTNPTWLRFSDELLRIGGWMPNTNIAARTAIGTPDVVGFSVGNEDHELQVEYRLQRWLTTATEVPNDAAADGMLRDAAGYILNSHSFLSRATQVQGGADNNGVRVYTYGTGGKFGTIRIAGDPGTSEPIIVSGTYRFRKARSYAISQPAASDTVTVVSTSASDTTQSITIESEGAAQSETLALNGTTPVIGITSFPNIDAMRLTAQTVGDVIVQRTTGGIELARILGSASQQGTVGDLGLPLLGSGSFEGALGTAFENILGDGITRGGNPIDTHVMTMAIEVQNNLQADPTVYSKEKIISEGMRNITAQATVFSETGSHTAAVEHLQALGLDIVWTMTGGSVTLPSAVLTGPGPRTYEKEQATMRRDNTFTSAGISITP